MASITKSDVFTYETFIPLVNSAWPTVQSPVPLSPGMLVTIESKLFKVRDAFEIRDGLKGVMLDVVSDVVDLKVVNDEENQCQKTDAHPTEVDD